MGLPRDILTEVEKPEDSVHGVLDVGRVVFQAEDEELFFIKNGEPVQKVHGVQPDLQPHLGPNKQGGGLISGGAPRHRWALCGSMRAHPYKLTPRSYPGKQVS